MEIKKKRSFWLELHLFLMENETFSVCIELMFVCDGCREINSLFTLFVGFSIYSIRILCCNG